MKVTAKRNAISQTHAYDYASDIDVLLVGPNGQKVMLMSAAGGTTPLSNVTLTFDDSAASAVPQSSPIATGTYKPANYRYDTFPSPAPTGTPATVLSSYNSQSANGTWSRYVLDKYSSGSGRIAGGWSRSFTTQAAAPFAVTNAASGISSSTATLNASVNPLGQATQYQFQFGTDTSYTFAQPLQNAGNGTTSQALTGLQPATTYHFRIVATNATGTSYGSDLTFTTAAPVDRTGTAFPTITKPRTVSIRTTPTTRPRIRMATA